MRYTNLRLLTYLLTTVNLMKNRCRRVNQSARDLTGRELVCRNIIHPL